MIDNVFHKISVDAGRMTIEPSPGLVDDQVKGLILLLNQMEGVTPVAVWQREAGSVFLPRIILHCSMDSTTILLEAIMRCRYIDMEILRADENSDTTWCTLYSSLCIEGKDRRYPTVSEMTVQLSNELEQSGWVMQNEPNPADVVDRTSKHLNLIMDSKKLRFLRDFAGEVWKQRIELFKKAGWEDERTQGFPEISGNEYEGSFYFENYAQFPAIDTWTIAWQAWCMKITLDLHNHGKIHVKSLKDIENKRFTFDHIIRTLLSSKGSG